jgi:hypothetical protein
MHTGQSTRLTHFFNSNGPWSSGQGLNGQPPAQVRQTLSNSGGLTYGGGVIHGDACLNHGLQYDVNSWIVDAIAKRSDLVPREHFGYRLPSGEVITVPENMGIGHRVILPREYNSTLFVEQSEAHDYDESRGLEQFNYVTGNLYVDQVSVEERLLQIEQETF